MLKAGRSARRRNGTTLVELLVSLTLLAVVLVALATSAVRAEHASTQLHQRMGFDRARSEAALVLPVALRGVAPAAGDLRPGEARDTSLEFRATLAAGVSCGSDASHVTLGDPLGDDIGPAPSLRMGDTLWHYDETRDEWLPRAVQDGSSARCPSGGAALRAALVDPAEALPVLAPLVLTRRARASLYRSGDGSWQLGYREWNGTTNRFDGVQPVSGPYAAAGSDARIGLRFRYFDAAGTELPAGSAETGRMARIEIVVRSPMRIGQRAVAGDSLLAVLALRNRP